MILLKLIDIGIGIRNFIWLSKVGYIMLKYRIHSMAGESKIYISNADFERLPSHYLKNRSLIFQVPSSTTKINVAGFGNGNKTAMIYGGLSNEDLAKSLREMIKTLDKLGIKIKQCSDVVTVNIAISGRFGSFLDLEKLSAEMVNSDAEYDPEQFPALIYRMKEPKCVFLLFRTGSFIVQGLRDASQMHPAISNMKRVLNIN